MAGKLALADGRDPQFLTKRTSPLSYLSILTTQLPSLRASNLRQSNQCLLRPSFERHISSFLQYPIGYTGHPFQHKRGLYHGAMGPGSLGPPWGLAPTIKYFELHLSVSSSSSLTHASQQKRYEKGFQGPGRRSGPAARWEDAVLS